MFLSRVSSSKLGTFIKRITEYGLQRIGAYPWRRESDPYKIFVAEMLLQRTRAKQVVQVYSNFVKKFPTIDSLANAEIKEIIEMIKPLGLAYRAERLKRIASIIVKNYYGKFPSELNELLKLPGIGLYIACVILCFSFKKKIPVFDSNVRRVLGRVFSIQFPKNAHKKPELLQALKIFFPEERAKEFVIGLLDLGIEICLPKRPKCHECLLIDICEYAQQHHTL